MLATNQSYHYYILRQLFHKKILNFSIYKIYGLTKDNTFKNLYNATGTVSNYEVKMEYIKQNVNCTLDYIFVNTNSIADSFITIEDDALLSKYNEDKETYATPEKRVVEYAFWEMPADVKLDTINKNAASLKTVYGSQSAAAASYKGTRENPRCTKTTNYVPPTRTLKDHSTGRFLKI